MKSKIKHIEECTKLFRIEVPREVVDRIVEEVYNEIKKVAKIPGFRPGNAPRDLLEKHYSGDADEQALKRLVPESYKKALQEHKLIPVSSPHVFNVDFQKGKPLTFEAKVETRPNIKLKNYKAIKVGKRRISVSEDELKHALLKVREMQAKYNDVPGPVKRGDYAVSEVEAFADGEPIARKNNNMWILAEKEASLLGMGEELIGLVKGEMKEIEAKLPDSYPDKKYAGRLAKFKVLVKEVKERALPELDDAFAKSIQLDSVDALKKEIESQLFARKQNNLNIDMKNQILDKLLRENKFSVPSGIVERQKEVLAKRLEAELLQKGLPKEDAEKKIKELDEKLISDAGSKVRIYFILDDIAAKENIDINEKDIEERLKLIASSTGQPVQEVKKYYEKENLIGGLAEELKEAKTLDFLLKEAQVTETKEGK